MVNSYGVLTEVLGTKFNVRARRSEPQVVTTLFQGRVQMHTDEADEDGLQLSPGQTLSVDKTTKQTELYAFNHPEDVLLWIKGELHFENKSLDEIMECLSKVYNVVDKTTKQTELYAFNHPEDVLLWIKGELHFENKSLDEIMECLSKVYNVKVAFKNPSLKDERFTCTFKTDASLEKILSTLSLTRHFQYEVVENQVIITLSLTRHFQYEVVENQVIIRPMK